MFSSKDIEDIVDVKYDVDDEDEDLSYTNDKELAVKYQKYIEDVDKLKIYAAKIADQVFVDRLDEIIFFVLKSVATDLISKHYNSPLPNPSYKKLPSQLLAKKSKLIFDEKLFDNVVKSFVDYNRNVAIKNKYTSNVYDISNFSNQDDYMNVIQNILIENTI
jgi:hypothetical protein